MLLCDEYNHPIISKRPVREAILDITGDYDQSSPFSQYRSYRDVAFRYLQICGCGETYRIRDWVYKYYPRYNKPITKEELLALF